jgi:hypothetical protein
MSTKWDKYIVEEETSQNKWDKYAVEDVKKKDLSFEEFQTSMEGISKAPTELELEVPSTSTKEKTEKDTHLDIINKQIENVSAQREQLASDRESIAWNKIYLERDVKRLERELSDATSALYTATGRERTKTTKTPDKLREELKNVKNQFSQTSENLATEIERERDLETAQDFLEKSKRMLEAPDENSLKAFKEGLLSPLAKDFFTIGVGEMARQYNVLDIVNKYREKGEDSLTDEERTALGAYGIMQMASEDPQSVSYNVGSGVAQMIPYMVQFAMTGGVGGFAKESTKSLLKAQTKRGIKKAIAEGTAYAVGAAARTPLMTMTQEEFARRRTGVIEPIAVAEEGEVTEIKGKPVPETEETVGEAVYKSFATTFAEVFTEELGGIVTKPLGKLAGRIGKTNLLKGVKGTVIDKVKDAVKFNGVIGEYSEELANSYLQAALTKDKPLSEVWNGKEQLETALTVSTVGGVFMASSLAAPKLKTELKIIEDNREETFSKINEQYQEEVLRIAEIEDVDEKSTVLEQYIFERDLNEDQIKNVTDFIITDNAIKSAEITQEEIVTEKPIEDSEAIKKEKEPITIPEEKEELKTSEIKAEVKPIKEEVKEEVIEEKDYDKFKTDFLSEDVNLQSIDVPLKQSERIAAAKNLREGKITKQAEILEDYLKQSFESGKLPLVEFAAGKKTVRTTAPIESILKTDEVKEVPVEKPKEVKLPKVEQVESLEPTEAKERIRGVEQGIFQAKKSEQQEFVQTLVDANKESYEVLTYEKATEDAKKYLAEKGTPEVAYEDLLEKSKLEDSPTRQVARLSLMDYYSRKTIDPSVPVEQQDEAVKKLINLEKAVAREATTAGQASAVLNIWKAKQPESVLKVEQKKIEEYNKKILDKKISGKTTVKEQIEKIAGDIDVESKKIAKDIISKNPKYQKYKKRLEGTKRPSAPKKKKVTKERIKKEQDYRKERLEKYKKERGGTLQAGVGLTSEDIEFAGDMIASYVREGYYRLADVTQKLRDDFSAVGIKLTDDQVKDILAQEKDGKKLEATLREQEAKISISVAAKELGTKIDEIVKQHWEEKDALGRTLSEKFIEEAGLTSLEANELSQIVLDEYQKQIQERSQTELTKLLGRSPLPKQKAKRKNVVDRLSEAANLGALDSEFYQQLFGEYFGIAELTTEQSKKIIKLADNIQRLKGTGLFETDAARDLASYMFELYPRKKGTEAINLWIDMAYASLLSGVSTSVLNMVSAGSNIAAKPVRDLVNLSKWIDIVRKHKTKERQAIYNPFGEMVYLPALSGIKFGAKEAKKIYQKGGIGNKYIEQVADNKSFKVSELERGKFGEGKRFIPVNVKVGDKKFDINIFNAYKYSGRNLLAQDRLMFNTIHDIELASIIADKFAKKGLSGKKLRKAVLDELRAKNVDQEVLNTRLDNEIVLYEQLTGKKVDKLDRDLRKREIELEMMDLTPEERAEAEQIARSNIFTDDRGGLIAHIAYSIGALSNKNPVSQAIVKPFVPFTKIVGNVTEYMMDHIPVYGQLRAHGWSPTGLYKRWVDPNVETAQMGDKGSKAYYEQLGRAWLGTTAFALAMMLGLGSDEDDFIQITGGRNKEGWKKAGRQEVTPNYTIRIGDVLIPYMNIPSLAIPLGLIGNINDELQQGMSEGDLKDRLTASLLLTGGYNTLTMTKDMSIVQGISALTKLVTDVLTASEDRWNKIGEETAKRYLGFAAKPLPQNVNIVKQIEKFFDPTSYSRKDMKEILAYTAGIEHFFDINKPSIDQLGDVVETYPGETLLPYTHWLGLKGGDVRWKFLSKYNAIPTKIFNTQKSIETTDGFEKRRMTSDEFYEYTKLAGKKFSQGLERYMAKNNISELAKEKVFDRQRDEEITKIQDDLNKLRSKSNRDAFTELFRWGVAKKDKPQEFKLAKKYNALKPYASSKKISIKGAPDYTLDKGELYKFNSYATLEYLDILSNNNKTMDFDALQKFNFTDEEGVTRNALEESTNLMWKQAKGIALNKHLNSIVSIDKLLENK